MKEIELLIKRENALSKQNLLYQLLGKFNDNLSKQIQNAIRLITENENKKYNKLRTKIAKQM